MDRDDSVVSSGRVSLSAESKIAAFSCLAPWWGGLEVSTWGLSSVRALEELYFLRGGPGLQVFQVTKKLKGLL